MGHACRRVAPLVAAALLTAVVFPAHAQLFGGDDTARKQIAEQTRRIDGLAEQLIRIEESLRALSASNPAVELSQQIERVRQEVMQLRGQVEVLGNENQAAAKRARDMYLDLDSRLKRLEQAPVAAAPPAAGAPAAVDGKPAAATDGKPAVGASEAETRAYEAAQQQRRIGNYQGAIGAFQAFLAQYPRSPLAHRAQYWIGDSQYNLRDYKGAIASQQKLIAAYSDTASVPDALVNIASCQIELGDTAAARKTLDGVVTRYPASEAAEKAKRRLATLK
jgi:tol-pal system protein YbgF